jgi:hypothetical protein
VHEFARPVDRETGAASASHTCVELLPRFQLVSATARFITVTSVAELPLDGGPLQFLSMHAAPAVGLEHVSSTFGEHDEGAVFTDGRHRLDEVRVSQVPQIATVRIERAVLAVAEIASRHDSEGADGRQRADLRAAQRHVAVACPNALTLTPSRQLEVAREHLAWIEPLAFARIG